MATSETVSKRSKLVEAMAPEWELATVLMGGTAAIREKGVKYLPMWPAESTKSYQFRLATTTLFPAFKRTVETLSAKPFSEPITIEEGMNPQVQEWLDNVDQQGRNLDTFAAGVMESLISHGLTGILVEYPNAAPTETPRTVAQERAAGLRPYFVHIKCSQVLGWRAELRGSAWFLTMLRFMEIITEPDPADAFMEAQIEQVRVLYPGRWETWRKAKDDRLGAVWALYESGVTTLDFIPFVPCYAMQIDFMVARPPLAELAYMNIKHYQSQSDQDNILHIARVPILVRTGMADKYDADGNLIPNELTISSSTAVDLPVGASLTYTEHTGSSIDAGKVSLDDLKDEMRQAGAEMLMVLKTGQATATEVASDDAVALSHMQRITKGVQDALNLALDYMGQYVGLRDVGTLELFTDFKADLLGATDQSTLVTMATSTPPKLSDETLFKELQRRGTISAEVDWEEEQARLKDQAPPAAKIDPHTGLPYTTPVPPVQPNTMQ